MKRLIYPIIASLLMVCANSCDINNDVEEDNQTNVIEYKVTSNNPDAVIHVDATGLSDEGVTFKGDFSHKCATKDYYAIVKVTCDDKNTVLNARLYVNGSPVVDIQDKYRILINYRLKGGGPVLEQPRPKH